MKISLFNSLGLTAVLLLAGAVLPVAVTTAAAADAAALPALGPAPSWTLLDLDGHPVSSDQFKGKVVIVDFWATWCPPCRAEIPGYGALQKKYGADGLVIIGVSVDSKGPAAVKKFADKLPVAYRVVMADDKIVSAFGGMDAIPTTFLIDRDGVIRDRKVGAVPASEYEQRVLKLLKPAS